MFVSMCESVCVRSISTIISGDVLGLNIDLTLREKPHFVLHFVVIIINKIDVCFYVGVSRRRRLFINITGFRYRGVESSF